MSEVVERGVNGPPLRTVCYLADTMDVAPDQVVGCVRDALPGPVLASIAPSIWPAVARALE